MPGLPSLIVLLIEIQRCPLGFCGCSAQLQLSGNKSRHGWPTQWVEVKTFLMTLGNILLGEPCYSFTDS